MTHNLNVNGDPCEEGNTAEEFRKDSATYMVFSKDRTVRKTGEKDECYDMPINDMEFVHIKEEYISSPENNFRKENMGSMKSIEQSSNENVQNITVTKTSVKVECYDVEKLVDNTEFGNIEQEYIFLPENNFRNENLEPMKSTEQPWNENVEDITVTKTEVKEECYDVDMTIDDRQFGNIEQVYISIPENNFMNENLEPMKSTKQSSNEDVDVGNGELGEADLQTNKHRFAATQKVNLKRELVNQSEPKKYKYREFCKCDTCGFTVTGKSNLKRHVLVKHSGEPKKFKCKYCKYATHRKNALVVHSRTHTKAKPFRCTYKDCRCAPEQEQLCECDTCEFTAGDKYSLKRHVLVKHSDEPKMYKCKVCKYATHTKKYLVLHSRIHTNEKPFRCTYKDCRCAPGQEQFCKCDTCGFTAAGKFHLKRHTLVKHSGEPKKYKCRDCMYTTHMKSSLVEHSRIHTNDKPFRCTYKDCRCAPGQEEFCKCDTCEFTASKKYSLKRHVLAKHSGEPKNYKCINCKFTTHTKDSLLLHSRIHTNEKPWKCTYKNCRCAPGQGENICKCDTCGYATKQKYNLKRHVLTMHSGEQKNKS